MLIAAYPESNYLLNYLPFIVIIHYFIMGPERLGVDFCPGDLGRINFGPEHTDTIIFFVFVGNFNV